MVKRMKARKGFIHAVEGVMAAILLLTYMASISSSHLQKSDWNSNMMKQEGAEYLSSLDAANLLRLAVEGKESTLAGINRFFFPGFVTSIVSENLPKTKIYVGVVANYSNDPVIYFNAAPQDNVTCKALYGVSGESSCIRNSSSSNPFGVNFTLADTDGGVRDNRLNYDSVYIGNAGPFLQNYRVAIGLQQYSVGYVDNKSKSAAFWNASWASKFGANMLPVNINGRSMAFSFYGADPKRNIAQFDALLIAGALNISGSETELRAFLRNGGGIVEVANLSDANFNGAQKNIFGIDKVNYSIIGNSNATSFNRKAPFLEPAGVKEYFAGGAIRIDAPVTDTTGFDVSLLPNPGAVRLGVFNTTSGSLYIALDNTTSANYDALYLDANNNNNFSDDLTKYVTGSSFSIFQNTYTVKSINANGTFVDIRPKDNNTLRNIANPLNLSYSGTGGAVLFQENYYAVSTNAPASTFAISLNAAPVLGTPGTLPYPSNGHRFAKINQSNSNITGANYSIAATNTSINYTLFNIDFNNNGNYGDNGDGPFSTGDIISIGPENYFVTISPDGSSASFKLDERQKVTASAFNYLYLGRTVWMPDITDAGKDAWNYIRAAVLWASGKNDASASTRISGNSVSVKRVFVSTGDIYLPYAVEMYLGT